MKTLTTKMVAELLQASDDTVLRLIQLGEIQAERLTPRGRYRVIEDSLIEYTKRHNITLKQPQQDL